MRSLPALAVLGAAVCFATTGSAVALADVGASPLAVGAARVLVGGGVLGLVALGLAARGRGVARTGGASRTRRARVGRGPAGLVVVGALGVLAYQPAFFAGTAANGVAVGTVVALGTAPIATGVLDGVVRRRVPSRRWVLATAVALLGVVLVSGVLAGGGGGGVGEVGVLGVLASVGAGASYSLYAVAGKLLMDGGRGPTEVMGSMFGLAALGSVPVLVLADGAALASGRGLLLVGWLGLVTTAVAYLLFGWGLRLLPATTAATLTLAEPLTATLLGLAVLGERFTAGAAAGLLLIALGLAVISVPGRRPGRREGSRAVATT